MENEISDEVKASLGFETLKKIGSQKIYEKTHISKAAIEALLHKSFNSLDRIQSQGFISILERDYDVDLTHLKSELKDFFDERDGVKTSGTLLIPKERKKSKLWIFILFFAVLLAAGFYFYTQKMSQEPSKKVITFNEKKILKVQEHIETYEAKLQDEINETVEIVEQNRTISTLLDPIMLPPLKITPKKKVWIGIISLEDHEKDQKTTQTAFELDPEKNWLMVFGHGLIVISQGDEVFEFESRKQLRLAYEEGILREVSKAEFIALNEGRNW